MIKNGDEVAGAPLSAAVKVMGSGSGRALAGGMAKAAFHGRRECPLPPRRLAVLGLTESDLLLLNFKHGAIHPVATGVLVRIPRSEIAGAEVPRSVSMNRVRIAFADGGEWFFEVTKPNVRKARAITDQLGSLTG
jgi:hypothetical protein